MRCKPNWAWKLLYCYGWLKLCYIVIVMSSAEVHACSSTAHLTALHPPEASSSDKLAFMFGTQPHEDYFHDKVNAAPEHGGQRIATVLMYLCVASSAAVHLSGVHHRCCCCCCCCYCCCSSVAVQPQMVTPQLERASVRRRVVILYSHRTTPEEGGETVFPKAAVKSTGPEWSDCAKQVR